jgi:hypothetical protein
MTSFCFSQHGKRQDRQGNVTLRGVRVTIDAVESNKYYILIVGVGSLSYPARKAHAPYYIVICGLSGSTIFLTLSHKRHDLRKKILNIKCVLNLSTAFV